MVDLATFKQHRMAYGCMRISGTWQASEVTGAMREAGIRSVHHAYDVGFRVFDHADIYGQGECERIFGDALRQRPSMRDEIVIATKCGIRFAGEPAGAPGRYDFSATHIVESCERSLARLGVECIDLYQLHRPDLLMDPHEVAGALSGLVNSGKIRWIGVSNFLPSTLALLQASTSHKIVTQQIECSLLHREPLFDGTLDQCLANDMIPMAWSPLAGGRLGSDSPDSVLSEALSNVATSLNASQTQIALAWLMRHPSRVMPVVGTTNLERITESFAAARVNISREDWYSLLVAAQGHPMA